MPGIDFDSANRSRRPEPDNDPIVARAPTPLRFPPIAHVQRIPGQNQIVPGAKVHVAAANNDAAMIDGREIDLAALTQTIPVGSNLAMDPQSRHTPIREDAQADV